jgi:Co/Zn/Cd efflux system component
MKPAFLIGLLFVLIGAQATRVVAPRRLGYVWVLLLAAAGLVLGELIARALHTGGPRLGELHPVADFAGIGVLELAGALLTAPRKRTG